MRVRLDTLWLWLARAVPSALLASQRCVQVKAAEKVRVCLSGDAADVVPIAEARMRWRGLSSKCYQVVVNDGEDGWIVGRKAGAMMAWFAWASSRQAIKQASKHPTRQVGPRFVSEPPHLQLPQILRISHFY